MKKLLLALGLVLFPASLGLAGTHTVPADASDVVCTSCLGGTEVDESTLATVPSAFELQQTTGEVDVVYDPTNKRYCYSTDNDNTCDDQEQIVDPRHVLNAEEFLAGGTDYGAAITAAYQYLHDTLSPSNRGGVIELPRGDTLSVATQIDMCDETGRINHLAAVTLVGRGANRGGQNGSSLLAHANLANIAAAIGPTTLDLTANDGTGGRDRITCSGCNFITEGFQHGDVIKIDGFDNAYDSDAGGSFVQPTLTYIVYQVTAEALHVERTWAVDANFGAISGGGNESVTEMVSMLKTCTRKAMFKDFTLNGNDVADIGIEAYSDNDVTDACFDVDVPLDECTGPEAATGLTAITVKGTRFENVDVTRQLFAHAAVRSASNTQGQADRTTFLNVDLGSISADTQTPIGLWVDNLQAEPAVKFQDGDIDNYGFAGVWLTAGSAHLASSNFVGGQPSGACRNDSHGQCSAIMIHPFNVQGVTLNDVAMDLYESDGVICSQAVQTNQFGIHLSNLTRITILEDATTANKLFECDTYGNIYADNTVRLERGSSATSVSTITIGNASEATDPLSLNWAPSVDGGLGGVPLTTFNNNVKNMGVFRAVASSSAITNTTTETAFSNCNYLVKANSLSVGTAFRITVGGVISTDATNPQIALRVRWGTANTDPLLIDLGPTTGAFGGATNEGWELSGIVTVRSLGATGTVVATGTGLIPSTAVDNESLHDNQASTTTIDTTAAATITAFADWTTAVAANTITAESCVIERLR